LIFRAESLQLPKPDVLLRPCVRKYIAKMKGYLK